MLPAAGAAIRISDAHRERRQRLRYREFDSVHLPALRCLALARSRVARFPACLLYPA